MTLPLAAAMALTTDRRFLLIYIWLFGLTHFVLTLSVYLQSENLRHFTANSKNILLFLVIPLTILMGFYVTGVFQLKARLPAVALGFGAAIRLLDFHHLNRQSFGVFQLFKARTGIRPSPAMKRAENGYFACLTSLLFATFLAGGVFPFLLPWTRAEIGVAVAKPGPALLPLGVIQAASVAVGALAVIFAAFCVALLIRTWNAGGRPAGLSAALTYLGFQTAAALLAIVSLPLYIATLAIHYVEYHVLMFPRCFHSRLNETSSLDRCFATLRRRPAIFYGVIAAAAFLVLVCIMLRQDSGTVRYLAVVSIFDGLFVFHYFVEMLIWRFSDPFFRRTLTPLYFTPRAQLSS